jgi:biotin carboxylase
VPAKLDYGGYLSVKEAMCSVAEAFCYRTGFIKGDLMVKDNEVYVGEVAARVSGSFNSGRTVPLATGFPLHEAVVAVAMGERDLLPLLLTDQRPMVEGKGCACERTLVAHREGTVRRVDLSRLNALSQEPDTVHVWVKEGDYVHPPWSNMDKVANVVCWRPTREEAQRAAEEALRAIYVEVE